MKSAFFPIFFAALLLSSCEKKVDLDITEHEPKFVLHSIGSNGGIIAVSVTRSVDVQAYEYGLDLNVTDAMVVLLHNDQPVDTLSYSPVEMRYVSDQTAVPDHIYTFRISSASLGTAEATAMAMSDIVIDTIERFQNVKTNPSGQQMDELRIRFSDPSGTAPDYYRIRILGGNWGGFAYHGCIQSSDPSIENPGNEEAGETTCYYDGNLYLGDQLFNGHQKQLQIFVDHYVFDMSLDSTGQAQPAFVVLEHLSEAYFRYLKSYEYMQWNQGNPFAEPANVHSNVINGYGIFAVMGRDEMQVP